MSQALDNLDPLEHQIKQEQRILAAMRKTLSSIVRDVTPSNSTLKSPISKATTEDIIMCFGLITAREQEIAKLNNKPSNQRPQFTEQRDKTHHVSLDQLKANLNKPNPKN